MIYGVNIFFTLLFTLWTSVLHVNPSNSTISSLSIPESLSFEMVDGLMIVQVPTSYDIQHFVFDTGAGKIILNQKVDKGSFQVVGVEQILEANHIRIDNLELGNTSVNAIDAWAVDLGFLEVQIGLELDGIFGAQLLSEHSVLIDNESSTITFVPHGSSMKGFGKNYNVVSLDYHQNDGDLPIIDLNVKGKDLKLGFDTGANISVFDQLHSSLLDDSESQKMLIDKLQIQSCELIDVPYLLKDFDELNRGRSVKIDGLISADALATQKIFVDSKRSKIFLLWKKSAS